MAGIVLLCLLLFGYSRFCESQVMITTQPSDVAVPAGGEAVFTCVVQVDENIIDDDVRWNYMGKNITVMSTDPYMVIYEVTNGLRLLTSALTITNVRMEHAGPYKFVLINTRGGDVISETAVLTVLAATITTQPSDVTVCTGGVAVFTCVMDRNGTNITSDDVMWQQIRPEGSTSTLSTSLGGLPFIIITTISGDILNSTLTVRGVAVGNALGTSLYRCVVPVSNMKSRNASLQFSTDPPGAPMNIRFSDITSTSFVVHWDEVDDAELYIVNYRVDGGSVNEAPTQRTSRTITQLSSNTTYTVTVIANTCGHLSSISGAVMVTTNESLLIRLYSTLVTISSTTTPTASSSNSGGGGGGSGGAGGIIGGVVGGIIAVIVVIIIIVVLYCFCVYKKKGQADVSKETYVALQSPTSKGTLPESQYDTVDKPGAKVVSHQSSAGGVEYAVSTKTASMASLNEPPPEYAYAAVDKKKHIVASVPHQSSATGVQYAVSAKAAEAKDPHRYDEIRDEPRDVPHQTSATGAEYAVSTKATDHQYDDVKDKGPAPQGINYAEIQHEPTPGVRVALDDDPVVHYTQVS